MPRRINLAELVNLASKVSVSAWPLAGASHVLIGRRRRQRGCRLPRRPLEVHSRQAAGGSEVTLSHKLHSRTTGDSLIGSDVQP